MRFPRLESAILHDAVRCFGLDLKVGSGSVVEVLVEELQRKVELLAGAPSGTCLECGSHVVGGLSDVAEGDRNARHDGRLEE